MNIKSSLLSLVLTGISIISGCGDPTQEHLARTIQADSFKWELLNAHPPKDEEGISNYLNNAITYGAENEELWMSPKTCVTRGYGDCDDIGILGAYLAGKLGYPRQIIAVGEMKREEFKGGHVLTLLEKQENGKTKYGLLGSGAVFDPIFNSPDDLVRTLNARNREVEPKHKLWNCYKIFNLDSSCFPEDWATTEKNLFDEKIGLKGYTKLK